MKILLSNTTYQEFDAWLCNRARYHGFMVSYDQAGLIDDMEDIEFIPKKFYPLRIYLSKIFPPGIAIDNDIVFVVEKAGNNLMVCPKLFRKEFVQPIIDDLMDYWPEFSRALMPPKVEAVEQQKKENGPAINTYPDPRSELQHSTEKLHEDIYTYYLKGLTDKEIGIKVFRDPETIKKIRLEKGWRKYRRREKP